jgi:hypothetical protein
MINPQATGGGTDYGGCVGRMNGWKNDLDNHHQFETLFPPAASQPSTPVSVLIGVFSRCNIGTKLIEIADGSSHTIMIGEMQRLTQVDATAEAGSETSYDGWALGGCATLFGTSTDPSHTNPGGLNNKFFESPGSEHVSGANFCAADGSVMYISNAIDSQSQTNNSLFCLLGSMADGLPAEFP